MDIAPATRGHALVIPREHSPDLLSIEPEDLAAVSLAAKRLGRAREGASGRRRREPAELLRRGRLADGLPLPHARDPALRGRSAAPAVGAGAGRRRTRSPLPRRNSRRNSEWSRPLHLASHVVFNGNDETHISSHCSRASRSLLAVPAIAPGDARRSRRDPADDEPETVPSCPASPCLAVSRTTGFQVKVGTNTTLMSAPRAGHDRRLDDHARQAERHAGQVLQRQRGRRRRSRDRDPARRKEAEPHLQADRVRARRSS